MAISLKVLAPNQNVYEGEAEEVILPSTTGQIGVLPGHISLVTAIDVGVLRLRTNSKWESIALMGGFAEIESDEVIVSLYESQLKPQTKIIMVCHMINITAQILPIKKICDMAHRHGVEVLVDGAHCIGHFNFKIDDLNCDYYGSSLHKWLATPLGAGLLYVKKKHISKIWPLLADHEKNMDSIRRLSHTGTHPVATDLAIIDAIEYLNWIGVDRKEKRMRFLKTYWQTALKDLPNIIINTPFESHRSCGIGNVGLSNMSPAELSKRLYNEHQIFTVAIDYANVKGCRISPNVFTTINELNHFIDAMKKLATALSLIHI